MAAYPAKTIGQDGRDVGTVTGRTITTFVIDIQANVDTYDAAEADEIVIRLNGRPLKRMTHHQAVRAGVITEARQ